MDRLYTDLKQFGHVKTRELMSKHTTFKIGGAADFFIDITDINTLVPLLDLLRGRGIKYVILGGGSNMLVEDEGFHGVVIHILDSKFQIRDSIIEANAGCLTVTMARKATENGLTGFEWAVGVPGTVGGAVRGNAGAMGYEMKDHVWEVDAYSNGEVVTYTNADCDFAYRHSQFKESGDVVLRVRLKLVPGDKVESTKKLLEVLSYRNATQPKGHASIGCIFKNYEVRNKELGIMKQDIPEEFLEKKRIPAGWLVEQAGLKGEKRGGAMVSDVHGNFVINKEKASAQDVLSLIEEIKTRVYDRFGLELHEEIQIIS